MSQSNQPLTDRTNQTFFYHTQESFITSRIDRFSPPPSQFGISQETRFAQLNQKTPDIKPGIFVKQYQKHNYETFERKDEMDQKENKRRGISMFTQNYDQNSCLKPKQVLIHYHSNNLEFQNMNANGQRISLNPRSSQNSKEQIQRKTNIFRQNQFKKECLFQFDQSNSSFFFKQGVASDGNQSYTFTIPNLQNTKIQQKAHRNEMVENQKTEINQKISQKQFLAHSTSSSSDQTKTQSELLQLIARLKGQVLMFPKIEQSRKAFEEINEEELIQTHPWSIVNQNKVFYLQNQFEIIHERYRNLFLSNLFLSQQLGLTQNWDQLIFEIIKNQPPNQESPIVTTHCQLNLKKNQRQNLSTINQQHQPWQQEQILFKNPGKKSNLDQIFQHFSNSTIIYQSIFKYEKPFRQPVHSLDSKNLSQQILSQIQRHPKSILFPKNRTDLKQKSYEIKSFENQGILRIKPAENLFKKDEIIANSVLNQGKSPSTNNSSDEIEKIISLNLCTKNNQNIKQKISPEVSEFKISKYQRPFAKKYKIYIQNREQWLIKWWIFKWTHWIKDFYCGEVRFPRYTNQNHLIDTLIRDIFKQCPQVRSIFDQRKQKSDCFFLEDYQSHNYHSDLTGLLIFPLKLKLPEGYSYTYDRYNRNKVSRLIVQNQFIQLKFQKLKQIQFEEHSESQRNWTKKIRFERNKAFIGSDILRQNFIVTFLQPSTKQVQILSDHGTNYSIQVFAYKDKNDCRKNGLQKISLMVKWKKSKAHSTSRKTKINYTFCILTYLILTYLIFVICAAWWQGKI